MTLRSLIVTESKRWTGDWDSPNTKIIAGSRGERKNLNYGHSQMYTEEDSDRDEEGNPNLDNLEELLDFDIDEVPQTEADLPPLVSKLAKEVEEAERRALAYSISMRTQEHRSMTRNSVIPCLNSSYDMLKPNRRLIALLPDVHHEILGRRLLVEKHLYLVITTRRLGLYHADELEEEGFDTYFQGGLRSDENFNAREYWERISLDKDLHLSRSSITSVQFPILKDRHQNWGMENEARCMQNAMKRKAAGSPKEQSSLLLSRFRTDYPERVIDSEDRLI
ncbi:hypothetical protein Tco_0290222 [Tanacetum coccineum]